MDGPKRIVRPSDVPHSLLRLRHGVSSGNSFTRRLYSPDWHFVGHLRCIDRGDRSASAKSALTIMIAARGWEFAAIASCLALALMFAIDSTCLAQQKAPRERIDLNSATINQLESLPGVGEVTAKAIVKFREKSGSFRRVEDLLAIRGISQAKLERLRPYVMVTPHPVQRN